MDEVHEAVPVAVGLDASQLDDRLDAFLDPAHPTVVATLADDVLDGAFYRTASQLKIQLGDLVVGHLVDSILEIEDHAEQTLALALVAGPGDGDRVATLA